MKHKKRGHPIEFHDEYHRVQRELIRKYLAKKRRERQEKDRE